MIVVVAAMVALWLMVVLYRHEIRVRWWGYRLEQSTTAAGRLYYLQLLAGAGGRALVVAHDLFATDDAALRSFGVALANSIAGEESFVLLQRACRDSDGDVRASAITGVSLRNFPQVVPFLRELADHPDIETAMLAASRLALIRTSEALRVVCTLALTHTEAGVRAQAIDSLAEWGNDAVVDTLIDCLTDRAVFGGLTQSQRLAAEALRHAAPGAVADDSAEAVVGVGQSNGARAARALRAVTQEAFGYLEAAPNNRGQAIESWKRWHRDLPEEP